MRIKICTIQARLLERVLCRAEENRESTRQPGMDNAARSICSTTSFLGCKGRTERPAARNVSQMFVALGLLIASSLLNSCATRRAPNSVPQSITNASKRLDRTIAEYRRSGYPWLISDLRDPKQPAGYRNPVGLIEQAE